MTACGYIYLIALAISWALGLLAYETHCNNLLECLPNKLPCAQNPTPKQNFIGILYLVNFQLVRS